MKNAIENNPILTILISVILMLGFSIQYLDVTIMEARNFITAREMLVDNNWLLTTMNGEPRYQKPPLPTWLAAFSGLVFGIKNVLAIRFPGIFMVAIIGITSYLLSKKLSNDKIHALVNALITITSLYVIVIVIEAPWDIFTHGFMLLGIYQLFQLFEKETHYYKHTLLAGLLIGLSILCKGPVSIYVLLLPFLISYGIVFKFRNIKSKAFSIFSLLLIALTVGGWWYLYVRLEDPTTFLEITAKETGNWSSYNVRPFYYYWSFFTQSGLWTIPAFIGLVYPYMKSRVHNLKAYKFSFYWTIAAVILLSIIPEKKSRYLMPVLIPLAINTGFYIDYLIRKFKDIKDKREIIPVYFNFGLIALIGISFSFIGYQLLKDTPNTNWILFGVASVVLFLLGLLILVNLIRKQINSVFYLCIAFMLMAINLVLPLSEDIKSENFSSISELKSETDKANLKVYSFNYVSPEMIWQFGSKVPQIKLNDSTYNFPNEVQFGVLANGISIKDQELLKVRYNIEQLGTYDLNVVDKDSKKYRGRLMNHYYIFTKK